MATIRKRKDKYEITVSMGYDVNGRQIRKYLNYTPTSKTPKQIEKEVKKQAIIFEEQCHSGQILNGNIKFKDFADIWFNDRKSDLRPKTYERYKGLIVRINQAIGHLELSKIQPIHLRKFYQNLSEGGIRQDTKYKPIFIFNEYLNRNKITASEFSRKHNIPKSTLTALIKNHNVSYITAEKVSCAIGEKLHKLFLPVDTGKTLSEKTIKHYHGLISSILSTAVEWEYIFSNPCDRTKAPKVSRKEPSYLNEEQARKLLVLLENEHIVYRTIIHLLLMVGMRRGECMGLKWADIDFNNKQIYINRSIQYTPKMGVFEDKTKNETSNRVVNVSDNIITELKQYRSYQLEQRLKVGDKWIEQGYVFTKEFGEPFNPNSITAWFSKFMKNHSNELPYVTLHQLRHTNATLQIALGVPITAVANRLGHSTSTTTANIYAHAIQSTNKLASDKLDNLLYGSAGSEKIG